MIDGTAFTVNTKACEPDNVPSLAKTVIVVVPAAKGEAMFNERAPAAVLALSKVIPPEAATTAVLDEVYVNAILARLPTVLKAMLLNTTPNVVD